MNQTETSEQKKQINNTDNGVDNECKNKKKEEDADRVTQKVINQEGKLRFLIGHVEEYYNNDSNHDDLRKLGVAIRNEAILKHII